MPVQVPAALLLIQLPARGLGKAKIWASATHVGDVKFLAPGFGLAQLCLLLAFDPGMELLCLSVCLSLFYVSVSVSLPCKQVINKNVTILMIVTIINYSLINMYELQNMEIALFSL